MAWIRQEVTFTQPAQEYTRLDYLNEVEHANDRVRRLEEAILEAVKLAPRQIQTVIQALQSLRGIAQISAVTIVSELGQISRFAGARQLMGYSGAVASEDSSGKRVRRGAITKTGKGISEEIKEIAWKAQHRLHKRYHRLAAAGKNPPKIVTAVGRELLGFIWAIGVHVEKPTVIAAAA